MRRALQVLVLLTLAVPITAFECGGDWDGNNNHGVNIRSYPNQDKAQCKAKCADQKSPYCLGWTVIDATKQCYIKSQVKDMEGEHGTTSGYCYPTCPDQCENYNFNGHNSPSDGFEVSNIQFCKKRCQELNLDGGCKGWTVVIDGRKQPGKGKYRCFTKTSVQGGYFKDAQAGVVVSGICGQHCPAHHEAQELEFKTCAAGFSSGCWPGTAMDDISNNDICEAMTIAMSADTYTFDTDSKVCTPAHCGINKESKTIYPYLNPDPSSTVYTAVTCDDSGARFALRTLAKAVSTLPKLSHVGVNVLVAGIGVAALFFVVARMSRRTRRHELIADTELVSDVSEVSQAAQ